MRFAPKSLQLRIALYFIGLLALVQLLTHLVVNDANTRIAAEHTNAELSQGERVLKRLLDERGSRLHQAVHILVADFAFKKTVAAADPATMQSALDNHGARLRADTAIVVSDSRQVIASFGLPVRIAPEVLTQLILSIEKKEDQTFIAVIDGKAIQFAVEPILMPDPRGWAAFGFVLDDKVAADLKQITNLDISILAKDDATTTNISASTLQGEPREELKNWLSYHPSNSAQHLTFTLAGHDYASANVMLDTDTTTHASVLIQKSVEQSTAPFKRLSLILSAVAFIGVLAGVLSSIGMARAIARPIELLTQVTQRIRKGERAVDIPTDFAGEIGQLAQGFEQMNQEIEKREDEILRLAFVDPLTQLVNRAGLMNEAQKLPTSPHRAACTAVVALDIARLQHINDALGYGIGDQVIKAVAARLTRLARADERVARAQGGGFAWLMSDASVGMIQARVQAVVDDFVTQPVQINHQNIDTDLHVGWAVLESNHLANEDFNELYRRAEIALHTASVRQLSPLQHDQTMDVDSGPMLGLLTELRHAVEHKELVLHYQPKLSITGIPVGVEALVRWNHPTKGFLGPGAFVEFAEQTGAIRDITRYVIVQALEQSRQWHLAGMTIPIAVNISARDLQDESFPEFVRDALTMHAAKPESLKLEITERALMDNAGATERTLQELNQLGVQVSLDDYGTGYATLSHLSRFTVSELKIDRSFITGLTTDSRNFAIAATTVELGHRLKMRVVAEGVETPSELEALKQTGCDEMQGYLFAKPMSATDLQQWWQSKLTIPTMAMAAMSADVAILKARTFSA
jgi:diguanylate cyclase (GGDEF)-like protein